MNPKALLVVSAASETVVGAALVAAPSAPVSILLGTALDAGGVVVARVAGAALVALGAACWLTRNEGRGGAGRGVVAAMMVYDVGAAAILLHAGLAVGLAGIGLWPAVVLHLGLAVWCGVCLGVKRVSADTGGTDTSGEA